MGSGNVIIAGFKHTATASTLLKDSQNLPAPLSPQTWHSLAPTFRSRQTHTSKTTEERWTEDSLFSPNKSREHTERMERRHTSRISVSSGKMRSYFYAKFGAKNDSKTADENVSIAKRVPSVSSAAAVTAPSSSAKGSNPHNKSWSAKDTPPRNNVIHTSHQAAQLTTPCSVRLEKLSERQIATLASSIKSAASTPKSTRTPFEKSGMYSMKTTEKRATATHASFSSIERRSQRIWSRGSQSERSTSSLIPTPRSSTLQTPLTALGTHTHSSQATKQRRFQMSSSHQLTTFKLNLPSRGEETANTSAPRNSKSLSSFPSPRWLTHVLKSTTKSFKYSSSVHSSPETDAHPNSATPSPESHVASTQVFSCETSTRLRSREYRHIS